MESTPLGFSIIGLGAISDIHARALSEHPDAAIVSCFSPVPSQVEEFSRKWKCKPCHELEEIIRDSSAKIAVICTPSGSHLDPALRCIEAGKHVVIEKPMEISWERARLITGAAEKKGVLAAGIFQARYYEASRLVKAAIDKGRFGKIVFADAYVKWYRTQEYYSRSTWRGTWALDGGGALMNQSIHMMDMLAWLMGEPVEMHCSAATLAHEGIEVEDTAVVTMRFPCGALGVLEGTTGAFPEYFKRFEISGMGGTAAVEEDRIVKWDFKEPEDEDVSIRERYGIGGEGRGKTGRFEQEHSAHARQYRNIIDACRKKASLELGGEEACRAVKLIEQAYRAAGLR